MVLDKEVDWEADKVVDKLTKEINQSSCQEGGDGGVGQSWWVLGVMEIVVTKVEMYLGP